MSDHISIWLMPDSDKWKKTAETLSRKYSGPMFDPHVTLFSGKLLIDPRLSNNFEKEFSLTLRTDRLHFSDQFSKSCFIQFHEHEKLAEVSKKISMLSETEYDFNPHMSLFYGALSELQRQTIRKEIEIPADIQFQTIWTVDTFSSTQTAANVQAWKKRIQKVLSTLWYLC